MEIRKKNEAFTLIELMVAVAMLTILVGIATPNLYDMVVNMRTRSASREIYDLLQHARILAAKEGQNVQIDFGDPNSNDLNFLEVRLGIDRDNSGTLEWADTNNVTLNEVQLVVKLEGLVKAQYMNPLERTIVFNPQGFIQGNTGSWQVENSKTRRSYTLAVSPTGVVNITG